MIALVFVVLMSLILWFIIGSKGMWSIKAIAITLALYICLSVSYSLDDFLGWPSSQELPEKFRVHWIVIKEPDKVSHNKGEIYVWVSDWGDSKSKSKWISWKDYLIPFYSDNVKRPRVYMLDYSLELHERAHGVLGQLMRGKGVIGRGGRGKGRGNGDGKNGNGNNGGSLTRNGGISFENLPPAKLPNKNGNVNIR